MRPCQQCGAAIQMREAVCSACGHEQTATAQERLVQGNWFLVKMFFSIYFAAAIVGLVFAFLFGGWKSAAFVGFTAFLGYLVIVAIYYHHGGAS